MVEWRYIVYWEEENKDSRIISLEKNPAMKGKAFNDNKERKKEYARRLCLVLAFTLFKDCLCFFIIIIIP